MVKALPVNDISIIQLFIQYIFLTDKPFHSRKIKYYINFMSIQEIHSDRAFRKIDELLYNTLNQS